MMLILNKLDKTVYSCRLEVLMFMFIFTLVPSVWKHFDDLLNHLVQVFADVLLGFSLDVGLTYLI